MKIYSTAREIIEIAKDCLVSILDNKNIDNKKITSSIAGKHIKKTSGQYA